MSTRLMLAAVILTTLVAGCGRSPSTLGPARPLSVERLEHQRPSSGGEMVLIPGGSFRMGDDHGRADEAPAHQVTISAFYLDRVPVTQELYQKVMGVNPSKRKDPASPVERTQWTDAARFCNKCSELEGLKPCYDPQTWACDFAADGYRLPTEAEWEYACRAGSQTQYSCGDDPAALVAYAWFKPHSGGRPRPVGQKAPNNWDLCDMHGNVWQWCNDFYAETYESKNSRENPRGPEQGTMRVLRGGAWDCTPEKCRAAYRFKEHPVYSDACFGSDSYGFRRARNTQAAGAAKPTAIADASAPPPDENDKAIAAAVEVATAPPPPPAPAPAPSAGSIIDVARLKGTIVFVSDRGGVLKIWRMHASGKEPRQLTQGTDPDADPRFAPDGKRILYTTLREGFPEIWVMNADGTSPALVTKGSQGAWSPDGKAIVFIRDNQAYTRELDSGKEQRVTPDGWERCGVPAWSPDGHRIAVASRHLGDIGIFLINPDGTDIKPLAAEQPCCTPQWSPDGSKVLCQTTQGHIHQVDADGKNWEQVTFGADVQHDARYSPDGSLILFCRAPTPEGPWQICVTTLDGDESDFVPLTTEGSNLLPDWHAAE